ncbi:hypothetical protein KAU61_08660, partial [Klebsiella variicola]|nr:hypothetical protein [Klebsiella variicola]
MMPGAVPCGITADTLTITDVMAALGLAASKSAIGIELYLAKAGVLSPDNIIAFIIEMATKRASRNRPLQAMEEDQRRAFLRVLAEYVFRDYSLSAASKVKCSSCDGSGFIDAEVFTNKVMTLAQIQCSAKSEIFVFLTLAQIQCSAKSEIFVFPETSDEF